MFTVTDSGTPATTSAPVTLPINILLTGMTITTQSIRNGVVGLTYVATTFQEQGGTGPITWSSPLLPTGLTLTASGILSGTPTVAGAASITIKVTDNSAPPKTASATYLINIAAPVSITTAALPSGTQTVTYPALAMQASGGTPPYTWSASGLPLGVTLSPGGVLSGVPAVPFYLPLPDGAVALRCSLRGEQHLPGGDQRAGRGHQLCRRVAGVGRRAHPNQRDRTAHGPHWRSHPTDCLYRKAE